MTEQHGRDLLQLIGLTIPVLTIALAVDARSLVLRIDNPTNRRRQVDAGLVVSVLLNLFSLTTGEVASLVGLADRTSTAEVAFAILGLGVAATLWMGGFVTQLSGLLPSQVPPSERRLIKVLAALVVAAPLIAAVSGSALVWAHPIS